MTGRCRICGEDSELTFEHVPPRKAFNQRTVRVFKGEQIMELGPDGPFDRGGRLEQGGTGAHTLCGRCNNLTGAWYADDFVKWCYQGMSVLERCDGTPSIVYLYKVYPLRVIKQITTMFCSANSVGFTDKWVDLRRFLLNRWTRPLPAGLRICIYFNTEGQGRMVGGAGILNLETGSTTALSEISFPPFGYVLTMRSRLTDSRPLDITHFSQYHYDDFVTTELHLPSLPTHLAYPGDYRSKSEIFEQAERSRLAIDSDPAA